MLTHVVPVLSVITVCEADNLGIFLREVFQLINHWRSSQKVWGRGGVGGGVCEGRGT